MFTLFGMLILGWTVCLGVFACFCCQVILGPAEMEFGWTWSLIPWETEASVWLGEGCCSKTRLPVKVESSSGAVHWNEFKTGAFLAGCICGGVSNSVSSWLVSSTAGGGGTIAVASGDPVMLVASSSPRRKAVRKSSRNSPAGSSVLVDPSVTEKTVKRLN